MRASSAEAPTDSSAHWRRESAIGLGDRRWARCSDPPSLRVLSLPKTPRKLETRREPGLSGQVPRITSTHAMPVTMGVEELSSPSCPLGRPGLIASNTRVPIAAYWIPSPIALNEAQARGYGLRSIARCPAGPTRRRLESHRADLPDTLVRTNHGLPECWTASRGGPARLSFIIWPSRRNTVPSYINEERS